MARRFDNLLQGIWREQEGVLSFDWILLLTLLTMGVVGGIAATRNASIDESGDIAEVSISLDQSYTSPGVATRGIPDSVFTDDAPVFDERGHNTQGSSHLPFDDVHASDQEFSAKLA
jgi:hypothetical protein